MWDSQQRCPGRVEELFLVPAVGARPTGHVRLAPALAADDGGEILDEVTGAGSGLLPLRAAEGPEMELIPVIDHEDGGSAKPGFLQAIQQFLEEGRGAFKGFNQVGCSGFALQDGSEEGIGLTGGIGGLGLLESLFGFDGGGLDFACTGVLGGAGRFRPERSFRGKGCALGKNPPRPREGSA